MKRMIRLFFVSLFIYSLLHPYSIVLSKDSSPDINSNKEESSFDETRYDVDELNEYDYKPINTKDYKSIDDLINELLAKYQIDSNDVSIDFQNLTNNDYYELNVDQLWIAASTTKVVISALYIDLMNQDLVNWETQIPYVPAYAIYDSPLETRGQSSYSVEYLIYEALVHSDNVATYHLVYYYINNFADLHTAILNFINYDKPISDEYYYDNYASADMLTKILNKVATQPEYKPIVDLMLEAEPPQLFQRFITHGMATKYGNLDDVLHDTGIFFDDSGKPVYTLVAMTHNEWEFIEELGLRVNEWV